jgi:hypothetical protein
MKEEHQKVSAWSPGHNMLPIDTCGAPPIEFVLQQLREHHDRDDSFEVRESDHVKGIIVGKTANPGFAPHQVLIFIKDFKGVEDEALLPDHMVSQINDFIENMRKNWSMIAGIFVGLNCPVEAFLKVADGDFFWAERPAVQDSLGGRFTSVVTYKIGKWNMVEGAWELMKNQLNRGGPPIPDKHVDGLLEDLMRTVNDAVDFLEAEGKNAGSVDTARLHKIRENLHHFDKRFDNAGRLMEMLQNGHAFSGPFEHGLEKFAHRGIESNNPQEQQAISEKMTFLKDKVNQMRTITKTIQRLIDSDNERAKLQRALLAVQN